ncbi:MAG: hypothetical protein E7620_03195 [Ruminococcaceae bacterium]|nr:hypothetical protein [Oscillospiraceae bacterium]
MRVMNDWDCRLLPMSGEWITSPTDTAKAMMLLKEKYNLKRFLLTPFYDATVESISMFLWRRKQTFEELKKILPSEVTVRCGAVALLSPGLSHSNALNRLRLSRTNFLPVRLPLLSTGNWLSAELNRLLYHTPYRILFYAFDSLLPFYPTEDILRWSRLPNAAYCFRYQALESPFLRELMREMLSANQPILFGTCVNSYEKACYLELDHYLQLASSHFSEYECDRLFQGHRFLYRS